MEIEIALIVAYIFVAVVIAFVAGKVDKHEMLGPLVMLVCLMWPVYLIIVPFYLIYRWARG